MRGGRVTESLPLVLLEGLSTRENTYWGSSGEGGVPTTLEEEREEATQHLIYKWKRVEDGETTVICAGDVVYLANRSNKNKAPKEMIVFGMRLEGDGTFLLLGRTPDGRAANWWRVMTASVKPSKALWKNVAEFVASLCEALRGVGKLATFAPVEEEVVQPPAPSKMVPQPKKPKPAYCEYVAARIAELQAEGSTLPRSDLNVQVTAEWKQLSAEEREPYYELKRQKMKQYKKDMADWADQMAGSDRPTKRRKGGAAPAKGKRKEVLVVEEEEEEEEEDEKKEKEPEVIEVEVVVKDDEQEREDARAAKRKRKQERKEEKAKAKKEKRERKEAQKRAQEDSVATKRVLVIPTAESVQSGSQLAELQEKMAKARKAHKDLEKKLASLRTTLAKKQELVLSLKKQRDARTVAHTTTTQDAKAQSILEEMLFKARQELATLAAEKVIEIA